MENHGINFFKEIKNEKSIMLNNPYFLEKRQILAAKIVP